MTTSVSASLYIRSIEPAWLAHSPLVLVWVWPHSLALMYIMIAMRCSLQPKIQLSYYRDRVTLWLQGLNKHSHGSIRDLRRLFFSLPYFSFHTSMSIVQHFPLVHESVPRIIIPSVYLYMFCQWSSVHSIMQMKQT